MKAAEQGDAGHACRERRYRFERAVYEGMPCDDLGPKIWERVGYAYSRQLYQETQSRAGRVFLTTDHTGTHIDGPLRFDPAGTPIEQVPLERFVRPACVFDLRAIGHAA